MNDNKKPITNDTIIAYVNILEKQVGQMTTVVNTLEELNDKLDEINKHFNNGLKADLTATKERVEEITDKLEKSLMTLYLVKDNSEKASDIYKELNDKAYELNDELKEKIGALKGDIAELKSAIKLDRATNLVGLGTFIIGLLTVILRMYGKL